MALCKELTNVRVSGSAAFDKIWNGGMQVPFEGIYRCVGCGMEIAGIDGKLLPTTHQRAHPQGCSDPRWQLLVSISQPPRDPTE